VAEGAREHPTASEQELAAAHDPMSAWDDVAVAGPEREAPYHEMAAERGIYEWFAYRSPADAR
jgi:hypothetical protein